MKKRLSVRLPNDIWDGIEELSDLTKVSTSTVIRTILKDYIQMYQTQLKDNDDETGI
jgi:metal-responsive CopG/Arc/MetJ family transcriptional regulator